MDMKRRHLLLNGLFGASHVGLRAMATGLPAWFLANPLNLRPHPSFWGARRWLEPRSGPP
jgi:hypothetical protein